MKFDDRSRGEREEGRKKKGNEFEDPTLLILKVQWEAMSQEM